MNRRRFLGALTAGVAGLTLPSDNGLLSDDPERAVWVPGKVKVFDLTALPKAVHDPATWLSFEQLPFRADILYGFAAVRPDYAVRVVSA